VTKYDDLGDALLHALNEILCNCPRFQQLVPSSVTLQKNRTVVMVILPVKAYWITMKCFWNQFVIEDMAVCNMQLKNETFAIERIVELSVRNFDPYLTKALTEFSSSVDYLDDTR
jgi:hypothetical protein